MTTQEWEIILGILMSAIMMLGPWMFMVHAKLATIAAQIVALGQKLEKATEMNCQLCTLCAQHETRLETHDIQFTHIAERLEDLT